ncbi:erythromycin esterase family protein [Halovenus salina]|uniref:Erythromycin esterase family protein n=1 Tax=Halovenus salina TaxID=1510225 RepID=A0ABD5W3W8_9EURY|nr:erythromycin esterase family protein [Halovenus salina]
MDDSAALGRYSSPLDSTTPDGDDLEPLTDTLGDATIVGLGEATHGTHDLFELKGAVVRHLVADCGVRTVAFETDFAKTLALDEYVRRGEGTAADALDALVLWVWRAESILETVEWLRAFNEGRPPEDRVRLLGVSLSEPGAPARRLRALLQAVPSIAVPDELDALADDPVPEDDRDAFLDDGIAVARGLRDTLDAHRPAVVDRLSPREWTVARRLCRHLEQNCEWNRLRLATEGFDPEAFELRDRLMAETVGWCLDTDPGDGVAVWAHNSHVKRGSFDMPQDWAAGETMGEVIAQDHGSAYRPYATDFARGSYRAVADSEAGPETFTADGPPTEATTATLDTVETPTGFLDIESAAADSRLDSWFDRDRKLRAVAALVDPDADDRRRMTTDLASSFDGLFAIEETAPSIPLAR